MDSTVARELERQHLLCGVVKTVRIGDRNTVRYWDLDDENDSKRLTAYLERNRGYVVKQTLFLQNGFFH